MREFRATDKELPGKYRNSLGAAFLWVVPLAFLALFFFYPLGSVFRLSLEAALASGIRKTAWENVSGVLWFTIWQALVSTGLTLLIGLPSAFVFARYRFRAKNSLRILTTIPFILPTVVAAVGFNALLGPRGWINWVLMQWFNLSSPPLVVLNTIGAILLAHVFYNTTVVIRVVGSAWEQLDTRLEQAGRILGASQLRNFLEITLPLLKSSILAASLLVFIFDFTSFGVILLLGGPRFATLEVEIFIQTLEMLNLPLAGLLSAIQLCCTLLVTSVYLWLNRKKAIQLNPRLSGEGLWAVRTWTDKLLVGGVVFLISILLPSPMLALMIRSFVVVAPDSSLGLTLDYYQELFINRRQTFFYVPPILAMRNSVVYGLVTVVISVSLGILAAVALNWRIRLSRLMDLFLMLPLGTSAVTLGLGFLLVFSRPPLDVRSFPWLVPIAHSLVALPFVVRSIQPVLASIPTGLRQAAAVLGASPFRVWWEVDRPIIGRAVLSGAIFAFTISLGEFGATSFLSRPEYPTLPIAIFRFISQPGPLNYGQALAMATLLMVLCGICVLALEKLSLE